MFSSSFIADCAWKATAILIAAAASSVLLRRASASVRHLVWVSAVAGLLAIPVISATAPHWTVTVWRDLLPAQESGLFRLDAVAAADPAKMPTSALSTGGARLARNPAAPASPDPTFPLAAIWIAGTIAALLPVGIARVALARLARKAQPARENLVSLERTLRAAMGIRTPVQVLETAAPTSPVTWGILRPVILVPSVAADGDPERLRAILIHELAHIARADYLWQTLGQLACALYWFHPLVWLAQREALRLRERASDDLVLRSGVSAPDYAGYLVRLARALTAPRLCGSLAIARPSNLENRVRAILDPSVRRSARSRARVIAALVAAGLFTFALAIVRPAPLHAAQGTASADIAELDRRAAAAHAAYDFDEAAGLLRRALEARKARFGEDSVEYARGLANLGALYSAWDKTQEASEYYSKALPSLERRLGANSPELFAPLHFLGVEAYTRKDRPAATSLFQRAVDIHKSNHIAGASTALVMTELAIVKLESGDTAAASRLVEEAMTIVPEDTPERAAALAAQARVLLALGRSAEAEQTYKRAQESHAAWTARQAERAKALQVQTEPGANGPFRLGPGITPPSPVEKPEPEYTAEAWLNELQGSCVLAVIIGEDGHPREARVMRPVGMGLDQKAVEAIRQWRFNPGTKDGQPVSVKATVEINFRLK